MKLKLTLILLIAFCITTLSSFAQDTFERMHRTNAGDDVLATALHEYGSGFLALSILKDSDNNNQAILLTNYDAKGNINWTKEYEFNETDEVLISSVSDIEVLPSGYIVFAVNLAQEGAHKMLVLTDRSGNLLWNTLVGDDEDDRFETLPGGALAASFNEEQVIHASDYNNSGISASRIVAIDTNRVVGWGQHMLLTDTAMLSISTSITDAFATADDELYLLHNTNVDEHAAIVTKLDMLSGDILWSRSYRGDIFGLNDQNAVAFTQLTNGHIVILSALASNTNPTTYGMLLEIDDNGAYQSSLLVSNIDSTDTDDLAFTDIVTLQDSSFAIATSQTDGATGEINPIITRINMQGAKGYETVLKTITDEAISYTDLISPDSIGVMVLSSSREVQGESLSPYLSKLDGNGATLCHEEIVLFRYDSIGYTSDTVIWVLDDAPAIDSMTVIMDDFSDFNPVKRQLESPPAYCPNEEINFVSDASFPGAISYLWDDGTTDSVRVLTEEGMFTVITTVFEQTCYTLCDTVMITRAGMPMVSIVADTTAYCRTGEITLFAQPSGSIQSLTWSTGATTESIVVNDLDVYSVTVVDNCGLSASASVDLRNIEFVLTPNITIDNSEFCELGGVRLIASNFIDVNNLSWFRGEELLAQDVDNIVVTDDDLYTLQIEPNADGQCGGESTIDVSLSGQAPTIVANCNNTNTALRLLLSDPLVDINTVEWVDLDIMDTLAVNITQAGSYTVEYADICGDEMSLTIDVSQQEIDDCIDPTTISSCLQWPNALVPKADVETYRIFAPSQTQCADGAISNYLLQVYSRWGNLVFETNDIDEGWNGELNNNGKRQSAGTYIYRAEYDIDGITIEDKGDIALIR